MHIGLITRSQVDYAIDLANEFNAKGISVTLYLDRSQLVEETGSLNGPVEHLHESGLLPKSCAIRLLTPPRMRNPRSLNYFRNLASSLYEDGIEIAHILLNPGELWFALLASFVRHVPVITTMIVPVANIGERLPSFVVWATNKLATLGSDMTIVNGADQVSLVQRLYRIPANRIAYIPLSMHTRAIKWRDITMIEEEPGTVLFFGRAYPQKGLEYLIEAQPLISKEVPNARFIISAHGEYLIECLKLIHDPKKFEIHKGVVSGEQMGAFFQRSALVALPYLSASTSGVLVTAYSFCKPVVASRVGCLAEYVEDGATGLLVPPRNIEELAQAIIRLLLDDNLRRRMGRNAEKWMNDKREFIVQETINAYRKAQFFHGNRIREGNK